MKVNTLSLCIVSLHNFFICLNIFSTAQTNMILPWYEGQHMITECSKAEQLYYLFVHFSAVRTIMILPWLEDQHMITVWSAVS